MKALVVNGLGRGFDLEDVEIALAKGRMNLDDLISKRIALREVNAGYAALKEGSLNRVVVTSF
jgi:Zn-dependent alcohol dehydrogenase